MRRAVVLLAAGLASSLAACAAADPGQPVALYGRVDSHMADTVRTALAAGTRDFTIEGPGGYVIVAALISTALRAAGARLVVSGPCRSACALIVIGSAERCLAAGAELQMHRMSGRGWTEAQDRAFTGDYLQALGVPHDIAERTKATVNLRTLSAADLARLGIPRCGDTP